MRIFLLTLFFLIGNFLPCQAETEGTLEDLKTLARGLEEFPPPDNTNYLNPDYTSHHKKIRPNIFQETLQAIGLRETFWTQKKLMEAMREVLISSPYTKKDDLFLDLTPKDQLVLWGDIHGTFHSLVRCLEQLKRQGIVDDSLKILKPNIKLVFMSNVIDRSAYSLESLMAVLMIMKRNPSQVIYLRGSHAHKRNWQNYDFKRELRTRMGVIDTADPLVKMLDQFFSALPSKVFMKETGGERNHLVLNSLYKTPTSKLLKIRPNIEVMIKNQSRSRKFQSTTGLDLLPPEKGIPTWTLFSSPSLSFQKLFKFYNDSFSIVEMGETLMSGTITQYVRDTRSASDAFMKKRQHLISGRPLEDKQGKEEVWFEAAIGCTLDLSETSRILGDRLKTGIDLRIRKLNREEGIQGKLLKVFFENDKYTPSLTVQNVQNLRKSGITIFLSTLGTPTTTALLPLINSKDILVLFPYTGAGVLRKEELKNILHYRTSYANEARALVNYARKKLLKQKFGFFYQDDAYGHAPLAAAKKLLTEEYGVQETQMCGASYKRNSIEIEKAANIIRECNPDVLFFFSTIAPSEAVVERLGVSFLSQVTLMGISFLTDRFRDFSSDIKGKAHLGKGLDFVISRVVPAPERDQSNIVQEYKQELAREYPGARLDVDSLEGYINASLLIEALQKVPLPLTHEKLIQALVDLGQENFKGLRLSFNPETREFSKDVWLDAGNGAWVYSPDGTPEL